MLTFRASASEIWAHDLAHDTGIIGYVSHFRGDCQPTFCRATLAPGSHHWQRDLPSCQPSEAGFLCRGTVGIWNWSFFVEGGYHCGMFSSVPRSWQLECLDLAKCPLLGGGVAKLHSENHWDASEFGFFFNCDWKWFLEVIFNYRKTVRLTMR